MFELYELDEPSDPLGAARAEERRLAQPHRKLKESQFLGKVSKEIVVGSERRYEIRFNKPVAGVLSAWVSAAALGHNPNSGVGETDFMRKFQQASSVTGSVAVFKGYNGGIHESLYAQCLTAQLN